MITVRAAPPEHHHWLAQRAGLALHSGFRAIEAVRNDGTIVAMVGYDGELPQAICVHIAVEHPFAVRHVLGPALGVAFDAPPAGLGKLAAIATIVSTNRASIDLVEKVGFRLAYTGRNWCGNGLDFCVYELRRDEWRARRNLRRCTRRAA